MNRSSSRALGLALGLVLASSLVATSEASWLARLIPGRYVSGPVVGTARIDGIDYRLTASMSHDAAMRIIRVLPNQLWPVFETLSGPTTGLQMTLARADGTQSLAEGVTLESVELMQGSRVVFQTTLRNGLLSLSPLMPTSHGTFVGKGPAVPANFAYSARLSVRTPSGVVKVLVAAPVISPATTRLYLRLNGSEH